MASRSSSSTSSPRTSMSSPSGRSRAQTPRENRASAPEGGSRPAGKAQGRQSDQGDRPKSTAQPTRGSRRTGGS